MAIQIEFLAKIVKFLRGTSDMEEALDDVGDALDDVVRDGERSLDNLERSIEDVGDEARDTGRDGARDIDKMGDSFRDLTRRAKDAGDEIGDVGGRGFRKLGDTGTEVAGELKQNLGETFSSFRGDLEDLPQIAQDTLGGLAGSGALGGIAGLAATAAGAAGLGLVIGALDTANERAQALEDRARSMAQAMIEAGSETIAAIDIAGRTSEILTGDDRAEAEKYSELLGVDLPTAARAMAGDLNALAVVNRIASEAQQQNLQIADEQRESMVALTAEQQRSVQSNQEAIAAGRELNGVVDDAKTKFDEQQQVLRGLVNDADEATVATDELGNTIYRLPDGTTIVIDAETGHASTNVSDFEGKLDELGRKVINPTIRPVVDSSNWDRWTPQRKAGVVDGVPALGQRIWQ